MGQSVNKGAAMRDRSLINDPFWNYYVELVRDVVVPYQWEALNDRIEGAEKSHAVSNFRIAAGEVEGEFHGFVFQDSDIAKWLEAVAYLLASKRDLELERIADDLIDLVGRAQQEDGYLNTYYIVKEPGNRWTNLTECHELYVAGHMIEAGVAYYEATGKRKLLDIVCRAADNIAEVFGDGPGQIAGYDGHQEIELALIKLYRTTGDIKYLELSRYFIDKRGQKPSFFEAEAEKRGWTSYWHKGKIHIDHAYFQAHVPVREQHVAAGHAVRVVYMCAGMADVAQETGDASLAEACRTLWDNITGKQMYVTGGIGSMAQGEAFSVDYDLPNDTAYSETCAAIGLIFFAQRMLRLQPEARYAEAMERALYNTVLAGMARDGRSFFYVNPLEVTPTVCDGGNHGFNHVKPVRQEWFGCACCPPNVARLLASLDTYLYTVHEDTIYSHLFIGGESRHQVGGVEVGLVQQSGVPWNGDVAYELRLESSARFGLAVRIPEWSKGAKLIVGGEEIDPATIMENGYAVIRREWQDGDRVELSFEMPVLKMRSHPLIRHNAGKVALQRGPLVYCVEEADNGPQLSGLLLPRDAELQLGFAPELAGGVRTIEAQALRLVEGQPDNALYSSERQFAFDEQEATFIPYFAWANRGKGEMAVWVKEQL